jgi:hypothetical protein
MVMVVMVAVVVMTVVMVGMRKVEEWWSCR